MINLTRKDKMKMLEKKAMTKKKWQEMQKEHRATNGMNTGTRDMETDKHPTRARQKELIKQELEIYN